MSYPPGASRSCHEADGRSDRSGGSGGGASGSGIYGTISNTYGNKLSTNPVVTYGTDNVTNLPTLSNVSSSQERLVSNWKKWSLGLDYLLHDSEGVALFKSYLEFEGCSNLLDFWFACQGFRSKVDPSDNRKITQLIKVIYRTYIRGTGSSTQQLILLGKSQQPLAQSRSDPIRLRSETRHEITEKISRKHDLDQTVFDKAQGEVEHFLRTTAYPAFLKSDVYIDFLQQVLDGTNFHASSSSIHPDMLGLGTARGLMSAGFTNFSDGANLLPTLDEDRELKSEEFLNYELSSKPMCNYSTPCDHSKHTYCKQCAQHFFNSDESSVLKNPTVPWSYSGGTPVGDGNTAGVSAPLTVENLQMTRFYRTEMSMSQSSYPNMGQQSTLMERQRPDVLFLSKSGRTCELGASGRRVQSRANYSNTRWVDTMCPTSPNQRGHFLLPSHPPNPYHISYAPVSARDSEHHSLSSEARTDDTKSHTDSSSHDGICHRLRQQQQQQQQRQPMGNHYPSPFQLSRAMATQYQEQQHHGLPSHHLTPPTASQSCPLTTTSLTTSFSLSQASKPVVIGNRNPTSMIAQPGMVVDSTKVQHKHHHGGHHTKRLSRRSTNLRGPDKSRTAYVDSSVTTQPDASKSTAKSFNHHARSYNLAEHDPVEFSRILSDKLERLLKNQLATERLDNILFEANSNAGESVEQAVATEVVTRSNRKTNTSTSSTAIVSSSSVVQVVSSTNSTTTSGGLCSTSRTAGVGSAAPSILQRPWADKLLAAARVQHENTKDNAQAILEDHCSRIWAASADRTPTTSGSSGAGRSSGGGPNMGDEDASGDPRGLDGSPVLGLANPLSPLSDSYVLDLHDGSEENFLTSGSDYKLMKAQDSYLFSTFDTPNSNKPTSWNLESTAREHSRNLSSITDSIPMIPSWYAAFPDAIQSNFDQYKFGCNKMKNTDTADFVQGGPIGTTTITATTTSTTTGLSSSTTNSSVTSPNSNTATTTSTHSSSVTSHSTPGGSGACSHSLVIGYYMGDDPVPYRSVWPAAEINLAQFKQLIPKKKGFFRYFFKKASNEFDSDVVHQEITNDDAILPLWDGKIVAKVERVD